MKVEHFEIVAHVFNVGIGIRCIKFFKRRKGVCQNEATLSGDVCKVGEISSVGVTSVWIMPILSHLMCNLLIKDVSRVFP